MSEVNDNQGSKLKNNIRTLALMTMLFIFPLISWYYLNSGLNYQKEARAELKDYGLLAAFDLETQYKTQLNRDSLMGKIAVLHFFSLKDKNRDQTFEKISKIYDQFKERKDVSFLSFCLDQEIDPNFSFRSYGIDKKLHDKEQCFFLNGNHQTIRDLCVNGIKTPILPKADPKDSYRLETKPVPTNESYPFLVLVDAKQQIRNYYAIEDARAMGRLVEHLAMILPKEKKEGTKMIREREK